MENNGNFPILAFEDCMTRKKMSEESEKKKGRGVVLKQK